MVEKEHNTCIYYTLIRKILFIFLLKKCVFLKVHYNAITLMTYILNKSGLTRSKLAPLLDMYKIYKVSHKYEGYLNIIPMRLRCYFTIDYVCHYIH